MNPFFTGKQKTVEVPAAKTVLVLRSCDKNMRSYNGFKWPKEGHVVAPDWMETKECGHGLHGFLWGEGDGSLGRYDEGSKWLVLEVVESTIIDLGGKVKFPECDVIFCGDLKAAAQYIADHGGDGKKIIGGTATAGDSGTATAGYRGTATAGYSGTATAGDSGTATAGDRGTATAGYSGCLIFKYYDYDNCKWVCRAFAIGEDAKPNTPYQYIGGKLVEKEVTK